MPGPVQPVKPLDGTEVLAELYPTIDGDCEKGTVKPLATCKRYGKGLLAGFYCPAFALYVQNHYYVLRDMLDDMLNKVGFEQSVKLNAPEYLEMILRKRDNEYHINLLNRSSVEVMSPRRVVATSLAPIKDITIQVKDNGEFSKVSVFPEDKNLTWKRISPDTLEIALPQVDIHSIVMLSE